MKKKQISFLRKLLETPSPTGFEEPVAHLVRERLGDVASEIRTDSMGSVQAILDGSDRPFVEDEDAGSEETIGIVDQRISDHITINIDEDGDGFDGDTEEIEEVAPEVSEGAMLEEEGNRLPTLMLSTHMDEIGLMVTYISDDGFLSVAALGGVDAGILPGMRVDVHTASGPMRGVVGRKPIHLIDQDERKNVTPLDKLVIDLGCPAQEVKNRVEVGDPITFGVGFELFGSDMAVSRAFDDKCGVFISCRVMEKLAKEPRFRGTFVSAITVQEEIGTRGAMTSAHSIDPDVAIAFDVTHATDYPGIDKSKYGDIVCGGGPVIARGPNINPMVFDRLIAAAEAEGIDYQIEAEPSVTGTDARAIQVTRGGIPTGLVSVPLRYMHTPTEVVCLKDIEQTIKLLTRFAMDLEQDASFIPGTAPRRPIKRKRKKRSLTGEIPEDMRMLSQEVDGLSDAVAELQRRSAQAAEFATPDPLDAPSSDPIDSHLSEHGEERPTRSFSPAEAPFGRQHEKLSAEFAALDLDQQTIEPVDFQRAEEPTPENAIAPDSDHEAPQPTVEDTPLPPPMGQPVMQPQQFQRPIGPFAPMPMQNGFQNGMQSPYAANGARPFPQPQQMAPSMAMGSFQPPVASQEPASEDPVLSERSEQIATTVAPPQEESPRVEETPPSEIPVPPSTEIVETEAIEPAVDEARAQEIEESQEILDQLPNMHEISHGARRYISERPTASFGPIRRVQRRDIGTDGSYGEPTYEAPRSESASSQVPEPSEGAEEIESVELNEVPVINMGFDLEEDE